MICDHVDLPYPDNFNPYCLACTAGDAVKAVRLDSHRFLATYGDGSTAVIRLGDHGFVFVDDNSAYRSQIDMACGYDR